MNTNTESPPARSGWTFSLASLFFLMVACGLALWLFSRVGWQPMLLALTGFAVVSFSPVSARWARWRSNLVDILATVVLPTLAVLVFYPENKHPWLFGEIGAFGAAVLLMGWVTLSHKEAAALPGGLVTAVMIAMVTAMGLNWETYQTYVHQILARQEDPQTPVAAMNALLLAVVRVVGGFSFIRQSVWTLIYLRTRRRGLIAMMLLIGVVIGLLLLPLLQFWKAT